MNYFDEQLKELQQQMSAKHRLETVLKDLREQYSELVDRVDALEAQKLEEQADVELLEGRSLTAFFYKVVGKMDDKLTKEKQEAYEATVKYDAAYKELQAVKEDIRFRESELGRVRRSEEKYQAALQAKLEALKVSGAPEIVGILKLEEQIAFEKSRECEITEAIEAGTKAIQLVERILSELSDAEGWGTWDILGGGMIADMVKHEHLDNAQAQVEQLQVALRRFKTELADVEVQADMQVNIDGFLRFADYFFDGIFADWTVMDKINEAKNKVKNTQGQIAGVLNRLNDMRTASKVEQKRLHAQLENMVIKTAL